MPDQASVNRLGRQLTLGDGHEHQEGDGGGSDLAHCAGVVVAGG
jgi:hypothetical protein